MDSRLWAGFRLFAAALAVGAIVCALFCGCASDPATGDVTIRVPAAAVDFATNAVREYLESRAGSGSVGTPYEEGGASSGSPKPASSSSGGDQNGSSGTEATAPSPSGSSPELHYRYGGFNGSKAVEDPNCQIGSLKVTSDKLTYKWVKGGCENLGATSRDDYDHTVACAFFWDGSGWVGGKFDWISTSRTSRSLENIRGGYGGWPGSGFYAAKKHGFVIVSADGKKRSNFIED